MTSTGHGRAGGSRTRVSMIKVVRSNSNSQDFVSLVYRLDAYLSTIDGKDHAFYAQFNKIDTLKYVVVAYEKDKPVGCGAIKEYAPDTLEIKRMYTSPECRGNGIGTRVLRELETWAAEMSYSKCILETGRKQVEAVGLYKKNGYRIIPNFGQYVGIENSICFEKRVKE